VGWSGSVTSTSNPIVFVMDGDKSITATFAIDTHTLAVATSGSGSVAKSPDQVLEAAHLTPAHAGKVVIGGARATLAASRSAQAATGSPVYVAVDTLRFAGQLGQ
jgi:hypothetical protein